MKKKNVESNNNKEVEAKKKHTWIIIAIVSIIIICFIALASLYIYQDTFNKKYANEISNIEKQNESSLKEYNTEVEYLNSLTYDDLISNLIDQDKILKETNITIYIDDKEFTKEDTLVFDKVGDILVKIELTYEYKYKVLTEETKTIKNKKESIITVNDTIFPVLAGVEDKEITVGDELDILSGITATDEVEGELVVNYEGEVDSTKAGEYTVIIYAVDSNGNKTEQEMKIIVKAKTTTSSSSGNSNSSNKTTTKPSSSTSNNTNSSSNSSSCKYTTTLKNRGYNSSDKEACKKDQEASAVAKEIANAVLAKGYTSDIDKVSEAASRVSAYYSSGVHVESGVDYRTPYGVFIKGEASCAGCTRALIQVLEYLGFTNLVHANANSWTHQWVILTMDGEVGYADGQIGYVGYGCYGLAGGC